MQFITWLDYLLLPIYFSIICVIAVKFRDYAYPIGHPWREYFMPALLTKLIGAIFIGLIYQYYYGQGDTSMYFRQSTVLFKAFTDSPFKWLQLLLHIPSSYDGAYIDYTSQMLWYPDLNTYTIIAISGFFSVFTFNTYLPVALLFAVLSFSGMWAMFRTFSQQYPHLVRPIAIVILFIPSTVIWGSGIFKDTICMFSMGWMIHGIFTLLIQRKLRLSDLTLMILGFYLLAIIKIYILLAFLPALTLWIFFSYSGKIKSGLLRFFLKGLFFIMIIGVFSISASFFEAEMGQYSLEKIEKTAAITQEYINDISGDEGSAYSVGEVDFSPSGLLKSFPLAVNATLFRPYIWESRKVIVLFNALEAFIFLLLTLKLLVKLGPIKVWAAINKDANIQFCLIFTLIFGFAVGLTSGNFGALSRYRIPCLPLYGLALVLIYYQYNKSEKKFLSIH